MIIHLLLLLLTSSLFGTAQPCGLQDETRSILTLYHGANGSDYRDEIIQKALAGDSYASWQIATQLLNDWGRDPDILSEKNERARQYGNLWMRLAAKQGSPLAMLDLAHSVNGLDEDHDVSKTEREQKGFQILLAKKNRQPAEIHYLACCYRFGWGTAQDLEKASFWDREARKATENWKKEHTKGSKNE